MLLKICCTVLSECSALWMVLLPMCMFTYIVLSYSDTLNIDIFHYTIYSYSHFLEPHLWLCYQQSHQKAFKCWDIFKLKMMSPRFPFFSHLPESLDFIVCNKYCQLFSLEWEAHSIHCCSQENACRYSRRNSPSLSVILSLK